VLDRCTTSPWSNYLDTIPKLPLTNNKLLFDLQLLMNKIYSNFEIAEFLQNIATAYEIKRKNIFRTISYQNAAETVLTYPKSIQEIWKNNPKDLDNIPNIGPNILSKIDYLFKYNKYHPHIIKAFKNIQPCIFVFTKINGIGSKIAYKLSKKLKFSTNPEKALDQLVEYAKSGQIRKISKFGQKSEQSILINTLNFLGLQKRMSLKEAQTLSQKIIKYLHTKFPKIEFISLGSLRRLSDTVGDIDMAAKSTDSEEILNHFVNYPDKVQLIDKGPKKASILIVNNIRVDLMIQPAKNFASLIQHFTGSRQHNINLRKYALNLGYSVSEYGIKDLKTGKIHTFETEEKLYNFLKLCYIEPQKRIGENEIEIAQKCYNKTLEIK
jgi:DNA polymerase (family X)